MPHQLIKPGFSSLSTESMSAGTVRNMIDNFNFTLEEHTEMPGVSPVLLQSPQSSIKFVQGTFPQGLPDIDPLVIPGGLPSTFNWPELIRSGIERWLGNGNGGSTALQEPQVLPPILPPGGFTTPGGLPVPTPGGFPMARTGGRASFITMPNGLPGCPSGYHPEKQGKPYCVRNRRMNPLNPRALSRATRRVGGFARAVKRARTLKKICKTL